MGNGFFLLNVQGKIEMLNMLFFTTENNMVLSSLKQELERFGRYTKKCCTTKQATLLGMNLYIMDKATIEE